MARRNTGLGKEGIERINKALTGAYPMDRFPWDRSINYPGGKENWDAFIKEYGRSPKSQDELEEFIRSRGSLGKEEERPWWESATLDDFMDYFNLDFSEVSPVMSGDHLSSRVKTMKFNPINPHSTLMMCAAGYKDIGSDLIGDINVTWVNNKRSWVYRNVSYDEYKAFRDSESKGKYLNSNLLTDHGPA